jgi:hypothetical protein
MAVPGAVAGRLRHTAVSSLLFPFPPTTLLSRKNIGKRSEISLPSGNNFD